MFRGRSVAIVLGAVTTVGALAASSLGEPATESSASAPGVSAPSASATAGAPTPAAPKSAAPAVPEKAAALLKELLTAAGAPNATTRRVERTLERQTRVMYDLAKADLAHAQEMYCDAGDAVLGRFDAKLSENENLSRMQQELSTQLPRARELGCLNHIENDQVFSIDIAVDQVEEGRRAAFEQAAQKAVKAGRAERFLTPPGHPDAYHFEFRRE